METPLPVQVDFTPVLDAIDMQIQVGMAILAVISLICIVAISYAIVALIARGLRF